jgi:arabinofuranan 3-O-arabinosyltransferase
MMLSRLFRLLRLVIVFLWQPAARMVILWMIAVCVMSFFVTVAYLCFRNNERRDGNGGHTIIDFGGQYILPYLLLKGHGQHLYDLRYQRSALEQLYPKEDQPPPKVPKEGEKPEPNVSDADQLLGWFVGRESEATPLLLVTFATPLAGHDTLGFVILTLAAKETATPPRILEATKKRRGGPLYPPTQALMFAPMGLLQPQSAYRLMQVLNLVLLVWCGWCVSRLGSRSIPWPVAIVGLMCFPGFGGGLNLAQNPTWSLAFLLTGWLMMTRNRPLAGGAVWGLLAFKPVWAVAFFPTLLLTGRWKAAATMATAGLVFVALTLPFCGVEPWNDWYQQGKAAASGYDTDYNWVHLSRDLSNALRRFVVTFDDGSASNHKDWLPILAGYVPWVTTVAIWLIICLSYRKSLRGNDGVGPAFVMLGGYLSCFHFMYYDALLAAFPMALLLVQPRRLFEPRFLGSAPESAELLDYFRPLSVSGFVYRALPPVPLLPGGLRWRAVACSLPLTAYLAVSLGHYWRSVFDPPVDTYVFWALWLWCGVVVVRGAPFARLASTRREREPRALSERHCVSVPVGEEPARSRSAAR